MSLLEVIVAMGLALGALTLMIQLLVPSARISLRGAARTEVQESCVIALRQLAADLQRSNASAITLRNTVSTGPGLVVIQPLQLDSSDAESRYLPELWDYVFRPGPGTLTRRRWEPVPAVLGVTLESQVGTRLTGTQLDRLLNLTGAREECILAHNVKEFSLGGSVQPPNFPNPVTLHMLVEKKVTSGDPDRFRLDQTVMLRNVP